MNCLATPILIVEDHEPTRDALTTILSADYTCLAAANGEEAIRLLGARFFKLVLTDIHMPGASGLEVCRFAHRICPNTVVMAISGMDDIRYEVEALRQGALYYLQKPLDADRLLVLVESALRCQALAELRRAKVRKVRAAGDKEKVSPELSKALSKIDVMCHATVDALTKAFEERDAETRSHSNRVAVYSLRIGQEIGLAADELKALELGALFHDIGKIGIRDAILLKPSRLTGEEWKEMRKHPEKGARIIGEVAYLRDALPVVKQHHERWDGKGYPVGLTGEEIDIKARVFAAADAIDAITSERPYHKGRSFEYAREELLRGKGKQFDPLVVEAFCRIELEEWASLTYKGKPQKRNE